MHNSCIHVKKKNEKKNHRLGIVAVSHKCWTVLCEM